MTKLTEFTFPDTGETVLIRKVSPLLLLRLREQFPEPRPPEQEVDYGDGIKRLEENKAHPDYLRQKEAYEVMMEGKARRLLLKRGVKVEWTEERHRDLAELRAEWEEENGQPLPEHDDVVAWVSYVAVGSDRDLMDLLDILLRRSGVTEAGVEHALNRFPAELPGT